MATVATATMNASTIKYDVNYDQYSLSASALNLPPVHTPASLPPSGPTTLSPTAMSPTATQNNKHGMAALNTYTSSQLPMVSSQQQHHHQQDGYMHNTAYADTVIASTNNHPSAGPSSPVYSPPGLSVSTSVSTTSDIVSPGATALPSPRRAGEYSSPLEGLPEWSHIVIPPLYPPQVQHPDSDFDDWDRLPELLRQEPRADFTPRRPMNAYFIYMRLRRAQFANANPTLSTGDLSKILGKEWGSMPVDKKGPWNELYERLMKAFKTKFPEYQYERSGKRNKKRRPRSAPTTPTALLIRTEQQRGNVMTPRYAPYHIPGQPQYAVYPTHPHAYPVQQVHYRPEHAWAAQQGYAQYAPPPMSAPLPMDMQQQQQFSMQEQQQMHPQGYGWSGPEPPMSAPMPGYAAEPVWDDYLHH